MVFFDPLKALVDGQPQVHTLCLGVCVSSSPTDTDLVPMPPNR